MPIIYVILCEKNRFYIGKTERPLSRRIKEHFNHYGSAWTKKYKPIKVVEQILSSDEFDEDKYTKKYMKKYGIDKVRGGTYTQIKLPEYSVLALQKELCSVSDSCFRCNRQGHFANQCYASTKSDGTIIDEDTDEEKYWDCDYCDEEFTSEYEACKHEKKCKQLTIKKIAKELLIEQTQKTCFKCGRSGHYANQCYAHTHMNGKRI